MLNSSSDINLMRVVVFAIAWVFLQFVVVVPVWWLWNFAVSDIFGLPVLSYGQALALFVLIRMIVSPPKVKLELS